MIPPYPSLENSITFKFLEDDGTMNLSVKNVVTIENIKKKIQIFESIELILSLLALLGRDIGNAKKNVNKIIKTLVIASVLIPLFFEYKAMTSGMACFKNVK